MRFRGVGHSTVRPWPSAPRNWVVEKKGAPPAPIPVPQHLQRQGSGAEPPPPVHVPAPLYPGFKSVAATRAVTLRELGAHFMKAVPYESTWQRVKPDVYKSKDPPYSDEDCETVTGTRYILSPVDTLAEAQGLFFHCPLCHGTDENHLVDVGFAGRAPPSTFSRDSDGKDSRWQILPGSTGIDNLQLSPSIWLKSSSGCGWHGFIGMAGVPAGSAR